MRVGKLVAGSVIVGQWASSHVGRHLDWEIRAGAAQLGAAGRRGGEAGELRLEAWEPAGWGQGRLPPRHAATQVGWPAQQWHRLAAWRVVPLPRRRSGSVSEH